MWSLALALTLQDPAALVDRLRGDSIDERAAAVAGLVRIGFAAAPALEIAARDADPEVAARAASVLSSVPSLSAARGALLARVPPGAAWVRSVLAPGGASAALIVRRGPRAAVVGAGRETPAGEAVDALSLSPDGRRWACIALENGVWRVLVDGELSYDGGGRPIGPFAWSADSRRLACEVREDGRSFVLLDGRCGRYFDSINELLFSPDGIQLAFRARDDGREVMVLNDKPGPGYWRMDAPVFSKDGVLAYAASPFVEPTLVVGEERRRLDGEYAQQLAFSPDGRRLAFLLYAGGEAVLEVDGLRRPVAGSVVGSPYFSPDGSELAYVSVSGQDWRVVRDEVPGPRFERIEWTSVAWSPDGRRLAYAASRAGRAVVVTDGHGGPEFDRVGPPVWSPDGSRTAYAAWTAAGPCIVVGGRRTEAFEELSAPRWSPDGRRVVFAERTGPEVRGREIDVR